MISKVNTLYVTGKLEQNGYNAIVKAATDVQMCISSLMSQ